MAEPGPLRAVLVHSSLEEEVTRIVTDGVLAAGFGTVAVATRLEGLRLSCGDGLLLVDEAVAPVGELPALVHRFRPESGVGPGICLLVSPLYREAIEAGLQAGVDLFVIQGAAVHPHDLDLFITATTEPEAIRVLFNRVFRSVQEERGRRVPNSHAGDR